MKAVENAPIAENPSLAVTQLPQLGNCGWRRWRLDRRVALRAPRDNGFGMRERSIAAQAFGDMLHFIVANDDF